MTNNKLNLMFMILYNSINIYDQVAMYSATESMY